MPENCLSGIFLLGVRLQKGEIMVDVIGMGNAIVDITAAAAEVSSLIEFHDACKGGFFRTTPEAFAIIKSRLKNGRSCCGGSVANSLKAMSVLGISAGFAGKVGDDVEGLKFKAELKDYGVESLLATDSAAPTACTLILVHDDGEKSMCGKMGASKFIYPQDIDWTAAEQAKLIFVEGYWLDHNAETVRKIFDFAFSRGIKTALTLSDPIIVRENLPTLETLLPKIDIVLGNENEFGALGKKEFKTAAMTKGAKGVDLFDRGVWSSFTAPKAERICNTSGAGDAFAGGFLSGLMKGQTAVEAVCLGQLCAANVLQRSESVVGHDFKVNTVYEKLTKNDAAD